LYLYHTLYNTRQRGKKGDVIKAGKGQTDALTAIPADAAPPAIPTKG
jgi:hypothetical protein